MPNLFCGRPTNSSPLQREVFLSTLDAYAFSREFHAWLTREWVHRGLAPVTEEEFRDFDRWSLISEFRRQYPTLDLAQIRRGVTIEELWLTSQLELGPSMCLISDTHASEPLAKISRKQVVDPEHLVTSLQHWLARPGAVCGAFVSDGDAVQHVIYPHGIDNRTGAVRYEDPWPGRSLLCRENNAAGVAAIEDPTELGNWLLAPDDLRRVLVAVVMPMAEWNALRVMDEVETLLSWRRAHLSPPSQSDESQMGAELSPPSEAPPSPPHREQDESLERETTHQESPQEEALRKAFAWAGAEPYSRDAVMSAAFCFAEVLDMRGHTREAEPWYRQAAMLGQTEAARKLEHLLRDRDDSREAEYWSRWADERQDDRAAAPELGEHASPPQMFWAFRQVPEWEVAKGGPWAALLRGDELAEAGDFLGAEAAYQEAVDSGHDAVAPVAMVRLGLLLEDRGNSQGAQRFYELAASTEHLLASAGGWANLAVLLLAKGDLDRGIHALRQAVASGHSEVAPTAALSLGCRLHQRGDREEARDAWEQAEFSNHPDAVPKAIFNQGLVLQQLDDLAAAKDAYQRAMKSRHPDAGPRAGQALDVLLPLLAIIDAYGEEQPPPSDPE